MRHAGEAEAAIAVGVDRRAARDSARRGSTMPAGRRGAVLSALAAVGLASPDFGLGSRLGGASAFGRMLK